MNKEELQTRIEIELYGIVEEYSDKLEELGKVQARLAILGKGASEIMKLIEELQEELK